MRTSQLSKQNHIIYKEFDFINPDIQYTWDLEISDSNSKSVEYKIIPDGCIDIIFEHHNGSIFNPIISSPFAVITTIELPKTSKYVGIRFKPGKFRKYIDIDPSKISDQFDDFQKKEYKNIEDFLNALISNQNNPLNKFDNDLNKLLASSLSQKQKRRIFKSVTGFTVREFNKIMTFQDSLNTYCIDNYFDQSHKIRAYKSLVGMTPTQLAKYL
jgi:mRNA-degrading endonuclease RelE of RelBE toxin-antitoxin system